MPRPNLNITPCLSVLKMTLRSLCLVKSVSVSSERGAINPPPQARPLLIYQSPRSSGFFHIGLGGRRPFEINEYGCCGSAISLGMRYKENRNAEVADLSKSARHAANLDKALISGIQYPFAEVIGVVRPSKYQQEIRLQYANLFSKHMSATSLSHRVGRFAFVFCRRTFHIFGERHQIEGARVIL